MSAGDFERAAVHPDPHAELLFDRANMTIVLPQQFGEEAMVVEVKFERILVG
jgi:hypothetical protein